MQKDHVIDHPALDVGSCLPEDQPDLTERAPRILGGCCLGTLIHGSNHELGLTTKLRGNYLELGLRTAVCQSGSSAVDSPTLHPEDDAGGRDQVLRPGNNHFLADIQDIHTNSAAVCGRSAGCAAADAWPGSYNFPQATAELPSISQRLPPIASKVVLCSGQSQIETIVVGR